MTIHWGGADADNLHLTRMTLNRFAEVTFAVRREAQGGDGSTRRVADALESVLRLRINAAIAQQKAQAAMRQTWWQRWLGLEARCSFRRYAHARQAREQKTLPAWGTE